VVWWPPLVKNACCRLKDLRRVATRYDKLAANFLSGLALAAALASGFDRA
jgi:transposase